MYIAPLPLDEHDRLAELAGYRILDTAPEPVFNDITRLAAQICETPIALVSLVDADRQWFKSQVGMAVPQTHRDLSLCAHAILHPEDVMVVADTRDDPRFVRHPLVNGDPGLRFYAGAPIRTPAGRALGTVCVLDRIPRHLRSSQLTSLRLLAQQAANLLELHRTRQELEDAMDGMAPPGLPSDDQLELQAEGLELTSLIDAGYVYRYVSPAFVEYCGRTYSEIEGRHVADLIGTEAFEAHIRPLLDRALAGSPVSYDAHFEFMRRGRCLMRVDYLPVRARSGCVRGVLVRAQDVQTLSESRGRLRAAIEALD